MEFALGERQRARVVQMFANLAEIDHAAQPDAGVRLQNENVVSTSRYFRQMSCPIVNL